MCSKNHFLICNIYKEGRYQNNKTYVQKTKKRKNNKKERKKSDWKESQHELQVRRNSHNFFISRFLTQENMEFKF